MTPLRPIHKLVAAEGIGKIAAVTGSQSLPSFPGDTTFYSVLPSEFFIGNILVAIDQFSIACGLRS